jgi:uncharacterized coiled-coil protein SlyX
VSHQNISTPTVSSHPYIRPQAHALLHRAASLPEGTSSLFDNAEQFKKLKDVVIKVLDNEVSGREIWELAINEKVEKLNETLRENTSKLQSVEDSLRELTAKLNSVFQSNPDPALDDENSNLEGSSKRQEATSRPSRNKSKRWDSSKDGK